MATLKIGDNTIREAKPGRVDVNGTTVALYSIDRSKPDFPQTLEFAYTLRRGDAVERTPGTEDYVVTY